MHVLRLADTQRTVHGFKIKLNIEVQSGQNDIQRPCYIPFTHYFQICKLKI